MTIITYLYEYYIPGLLLRPIGKVSPLNDLQNLAHNQPCFFKIRILEIDLNHLVVAPGVANEAPLHVHAEVLHDEQSVKRSLILVRPINRILVLGILVVQRRSRPVAQKENLVHLSLEVVLMRCQVNGDLLSDAIKPLSHVIPVHLLTALVQLPALLNLVAPPLSLVDAQAVHEKYEPRAEQILQRVGHRHEYLLLRLRRPLGHVRPLAVRWPGAGSCVPSRSHSRACTRARVASVPASALHDLPFRPQNTLVIVMPLTISRSNPAPISLILSKQSSHMGKT